jgi:hypothetical protein
MSELSEGGNNGVRASCPATNAGDIFPAGDKVWAGLPGAEPYGPYGATGASAAR